MAQGGPDDETILGWFEHHAPTELSGRIHAEVRAEYKDLARVILRRLPSGADRTMALRALQSAMMAANACIANADPAWWSRTVAPNDPSRDLWGSRALNLIRDRRLHQHQRYSAGHDAEHRRGQLALAASVYAMPDDIRNAPLIAGSGVTVGSLLYPDGWTFSPRLDRQSDLADAGALCAAEIDRLDNETPF